MEIEYKKLGLFAVGAAAALTIAASFLYYPSEKDTRRRIAEGEGLDHTPDMELADYPY